MKEAHILALSGGKDSTALALHIKKNYPDIHKKIQYVFYDTGCDLKETYDYLHKIEVYLNKEITYIKPEVSFEDMLNKTKMIPTIFRRWCTIELKTKPFEKYIKEKLDRTFFLYIGIRADEAQRMKTAKIISNSPQIFPRRQQYRQLRPRSRQTMATNPLSVTL